LRDQDQQLSELNELLKAPKDLVKAVSQVIEQNNQLQKALGSYQAKEINALKDQLAGQIETRNGILSLIEQVQVPHADALKNVAFDLQTENGSLFCLLAAEIDGKASLALAISKDLIESRGFHAGNMLRELAKEVQGGGGGQPFLATAGGQNPAGIPNLINKAIASL
jgi:alanyl-tRNA synthetase